MERPPLFKCDHHEDQERLGFIFSNADWSILIYSESFPEGDRILAELDDFPALLEIWIGDSDHWGYALYEKGSFSAGCTLNREHAESSSKPPATSKDAEKICRILGFEHHLAKVKRIQRGWHIFSEVPCERFCQAIGAIPAILTAKDIEYWNAGRLDSRELAGWKIEPLLFEKRKLLGYRLGEPILHKLAIRTFSPHEPRPTIDPAFVEHMRLKIKVMVWLFRPIGWLIAAPFIAKVWLNRIGLKRSEKCRPGHEIINAMLPEGIPWHADGPYLVNDRHGCRIRAQMPPDSKLWPRPLRGVFCFFSEEIEVSCHTTRPATLHRMFDLQPQEAVLQDASFFIGQFPARLLATHQPNKDGSNSYHYCWFVELPRAIYQFAVYSKIAIAEASLLKITEIVKSFEVISDVQKLN